MRMNVTFSEIETSFNVDFVEMESDFNVDFGEVHEITKILNEVYEGAYEVTPKVNAQELDTKEKFMRKNVTVRGVPVYETSNVSGGTTIYIAKED